MKEFFITLIRYITLPLALLYGLIILFRNFLYKIGFSSSLPFSLPIISIGNLSVGGTGKSPHTEYLLELLQPIYHMATLSRGYKRATRGFVLATENTTAWHIGDEPMMFKLNHPQVEVCVCEDRIMAVPQLLQQRPFVQAIVLDDAFQHRSIQPSLNILITDRQHLYTKDYILPFGNLREFRVGANRADLIIVSKCAKDISEQEKQKIIQELKIKPHQKIFFSTIDYKPTYNLWTNEIIELNNEKLVVISGIANNDALLNKVRSFTKNFHFINYRDHHYFSHDDVQEIIEAYHNFGEGAKYILTTQKDATRLLLHKEIFEKENIIIVVLPIKISFLFNEQDAFNSLVLQHLQSYYPPIVEDEPQDLNQSLIDASQEY